MKCPFCGSEDTRVIDSRAYADGNSIKRRRAGEKQPYSRKKVYNGITRALEKRNVDPEKVEETVDKIERVILTEYSGEIKSSDLGNIIISYLLDLDEIAYVRFASVYKEFDSLDSFIKEIEKIRNEKVN